MQRYNKKTEVSLTSVLQSKGYSIFAVLVLVVYECPLLT